MNSVLIISCLVAVAAIGVTGSAIPAATVIGHVDHPRYAFNYAVNDPHTGDNKAQWEARDGGNVKGSYSLVEPDGTIRVVNYHADDLGFNAVVKNVGASVHPTPIISHIPLKTSIITPIQPLITPINYGFGAAPLAIGLPKPTLGHWSLPLDPLSGTYGGWKPILGSWPFLPLGPHATIISKKWKDGKYHEVITGPISLAHGRKLVIKTKH